MTLYYWMCKYVMLPCATSQVFMTSDNENHLRQGLTGCNLKSVGRINKAEIIVHQADLRDLGQHCYLPMITK
jgi:hypothetical protein